MSWSAWIDVDHADGYSSNFEVVSSHTGNLSPMWRRAGVFTDGSRELQGKTTAELAPILLAGLVDAWTHEHDYRALEPDNGWGDFDGFVEILTKFARLCHQHPTGTISWSG